MYQEIENIGCASRQTVRTQSRPSVKDLEEKIARRNRRVKDGLGGFALASLSVGTVFLWAVLGAML